MQLVSIDVARSGHKRSSPIGPLSAGLNVVCGPQGSGKTSLVEQTRRLLEAFRGGGFAAARWLDTSATHQLRHHAGLWNRLSLHWAEATGDYRIRCGSSDRGGWRMEYLPRWGESPSWQHGTAAEPAHWLKLEAEDFHSVYWSPLGETPLEKLWLAARRMGVHTRQSQPVESPRLALEQEERQIRDRLASLDSLSRDADWWQQQQQTLSAQRLRLEQQLEEALATASAEADRARLQRCIEELVGQIADLRASDEDLSRRWKRTQQQLEQSQDSSPTGHVSRTDMLEQLRNFEQQQTRNRLALNELADQLRENRLKLKSVPPPTGGVGQLQRQLKELANRMAQADEAVELWRQHAAWTQRLTEVQRQLARLPRQPNLSGPLLTLAQQRLTELSGGQWNRLPNWSLEVCQQPTTMTSPNGQTQLCLSGRCNPAELSSLPEPRSGIRQLVELSLRLAISELASAKYGPLPLVIDQALEGLTEQQLPAALTALAHYAAAGQQLLLFTSRPSVAKLAHSVQGSWICHLEPTGDFVTDRQLVSTQLFFLTQQSWIDEAPGIDPALSKHLHRLGVRQVGQWIDAPTSWLAERLSGLGIQYADIQTLQDQARLMCTVPRLRPFDAAMLVGCGICSKSQLQQLPPNRLVERVQSFLNTDAGRELLGHGDRFEVARLTDWLASAEAAARGESLPRVNRNRSYRLAPPPTPLPPLPPVTPVTPVTRTELPPSRQRTPPVEPPPREPERVPASPYSLFPHSPLVDAPSIGQRHAERFHRIGIEVVEQLLAADAQQVAARLKHQPLSAKRIHRWQQQALLCCQVPHLPRHLAPLLVASGVTSPARLAEQSAQPLAKKIEQLAGTPRGQRWLRGRSIPEVALIQQWIRSAGQPIPAAA
jgi:hypothetical protein